MAEVFTEVPEVGYSYRDDFPVSILTDGSPFEERRTALSDISRRQYMWPLGRTNEERLVIDAFLRARYFASEAFYILDPRDTGFVDVALGTGTGAATTFSLPSTGENRRFYPAASGLVVKVSGSPSTVNTVNLDARTVVMASPPSNLAPVTLTCDVYRLVRLMDAPDWQQVEPAYWRCTLMLQEVVSENG